MGDAMRADGLDVDVIEAGGSVDPDPRDYAAVIVTASIRAGRYQKPVGEWVRAHLDQLNRMPSAFVSVCLAILSKNDAGRKEADEYSRRFLDAVHWHPATVKTVAGALLYTQYNFFIRWVMKRIVTKAGGDTDTSRDYEYTDWNDVRNFAREFGRRVTSAAAA
jgi:menaquinone-dependent protoporphyrinogen oxidase